MWKSRINFTYLYKLCSYFTISFYDVRMLQKRLVFSFLLLIIIFLNLSFKRFSDFFLSSTNIEWSIIILRFSWSLMKRENLKQSFKYLHQQFCDKREIGSNIFLLRVNGKKLSCVSVYWHPVTWMRVRGIVDKLTFQTSVIPSPPPISPLTRKQVSKVLTKICLRRFNIFVNWLHQTKTGKKLYKFDMFSYF